MPAGLRTDGLYYQPVEAQSSHDEERTSGTAAAPLLREDTGEHGQDYGQQGHERHEASREFAIIRSTFGGGTDRVLFIAHDGRNRAR